MSVFKEGDRVLLADPQQWIQPYRRLGMNRRPATVEKVYIPLGGKSETVKIVFDVKRKGAVGESLYADHSQLVPLDE